MKKADLEKHLGQKIVGRMKQEPHSDRYGAASGAVADKREQRERDKAAGLVPFAVKLPQDAGREAAGARRRTRDVAERADRRAARRRDRSTAGCCQAEEDARSEDGSVASETGARSEAEDAGDQAESAKTAAEVSP